MSIYFIVFFLVIILELTENINFNRKTILIRTNTEKTRWSLPFFISCLILFCFSAVRYNIGADYSNYLQIILFNPPGNFTEGSELLSTFLVELSRNLGWPFLFFVINSAIVIVLITKTIVDYSEDRWMSLIVFLTFPLFYLNSFSIVRFFSALAIVVYAFRFLEKNEMIKYLALVFIASLFHLSALIGVLFFILKDVRLKPIYQLLIILFLPFIRNIFVEVILNYFPQYRRYLLETSIQEGTKAIFVCIVVVLFCLVFYNKLFPKDSIEQKYYNIYYVGTCIYVMFLEQGTLGWRFALYGTIYMILLLPKIGSVFKTNLEKSLFKVVIYALCFVFYYYTLAASEGIYYPFETIWSIN